MPEFVKTKKNEEDWQRAKSIVVEQYHGIDQTSEKFWKLVNHIFYSISGKSRKEEESKSIKEALDNE